MYLPYLRGKQYEFIALRELAGNLSPDYFKPIIEPVRDNLRPLHKCLETLNEHEIRPLLVINPNVGDFVDDYEGLIRALKESEDIDYIPCIKIFDSSDELAKELIEELSGQEFAVHIEGGVDPGTLELIDGVSWAVISHNTATNVIKRLKKVADKVVLNGDFFEKEIRNANYAKESSYTHWHDSYSELADGYSDYTILPRDFSESGGPAYVVAIHASYINRDKFNEIFVRHYISEGDGTPANPGGKFHQALNKLVDDVANGIFLESDGLLEFLSLHESQRYPGLGYVKKLSMKHHIETIVDYMQNND